MGQDERVRGSGVRSQESGWMMQPRFFRMLRFRRKRVTQRHVRPHSTSAAGPFKLTKHGAPAERP
jgi:hypothetical protein